MQAIHGVLFDSGGNPMSSVSVSVRLAGTATMAEIFSDDRQTPKANPFLNDPNGSYDFYVTSGRYDISFSKAGVTFVTADSTDVLFEDPADRRTSYTRFDLEGYSCWYPAADRFVVDGHYFTTAGSVGYDASALGGCVVLAAAGGVAGRADLAQPGGGMAVPWRLSSKPLTFFMEIQRYNFGVAGAARVGLTEVSFSAGDPANGAYIRQIDSASAFLVCRKSGIESAMDLGSGFASPRKVMFRARSNEVKAWMDGNYMGAITTNVPDSLLGLSISGGATTDSGGILLGAISIYYQPQVF